MKRKKWTTDDIARIALLRANETPWDVIAGEFGVKVKAVQHVFYRRGDHQDVEAAPEPERLDPVHPQLRLLERQTERQKLDLQELRSKLRNADRYHGIVAGCVKAVEQAYEPLAPIVGQQSTDASGGEPVDGVVVWSDQHADRVVKSDAVWGSEHYDFDTYRARLWQWCKAIARYTSVHLPNYNFETLWLFSLGDIVNGDIHNMKNRNYFQNSLVASVAVADVQAQAVQWLAQYFPRVAMVQVPGNHGRRTPKNDPEDPYDNLDYLVAATMAQRLRDIENVDIIIPRAWSALVEVRGHLCELNHGHEDVRGVMGIPWYGFARREGRVTSILAKAGRSVDYHFYGHYHTPMTRSTGTGKAIHAGAWFATDSYAFSQKYTTSEPEQQLLMISERWGRQMEIPIFVRNDEKEIQMRAGTWSPPFGRENIVDILSPGHPTFEVPVIT